MNRMLIAKKLGLDLAFDKRGINRPQYLVKNAKPTIEGPWTVYRW